MRRILFLASLCLAQLFAVPSVKADEPLLQINVGGKPNDRSGDPANVAFSKTMTAVNSLNSTLNPFTKGALGKIPFQRSATPGDVTWVNNCLNLEVFGGVPDGVSDNAPALDAALAALPPGGGCIYSPRGKRLFSRPITYAFGTPNQSITITGDGQNNTEWFWPSSDGLILTMKDATTTFHARDMAFTTGQPVAMNGIKLTVPGANLNGALGEYSDFTRVTFRGSDGYAKSYAWKVGLIIDNVNNVNVDGSSFIGNAASLGKGITTNGRNDDSLGVVYNISKSSFVHLNVGVEYGSYVQGMTVAQSNFTAVTNGVSVPPGSLGILSQLAIVGNQFATNPTPDGAAVNSQTGVNPLIVTDNLFLSNGQGTMVNLLQHSFTNIAGNQFYSPAPNSNTAISAGIGSSHSKINDNVIFGFNVGINIPVLTGNMSITNNNIGSSTTSIANASAANANNRITGNAGFQPQPAFAPVVATSPFVYQSVSVPSTVYIYSGVVSDVKVDNVTVATSTGGAYLLEPGSSIAITFSTAPGVRIAVR